MDAGYPALVESWRRCSFDEPPYRFPEDDIPVEIGTRRPLACVHPSFEDYIASSDFGAKSSSKLHLGLLPQPYAGSLARSSVFILMLNPGLTPGDYYAQQNSAEFRAALVRSIRQENESDEYPFLFLDPKFSWTTAGVWWRKKLGDVAQAMTKQTGMSFKEVLRHMAQNVSCLELYPYHSKNSGSAERIASRLKSAKLMVEYIQETLVPRAKRNEALIVAARQVGKWSLSEHENILLYDRGEARSAHLSMNSRGGQRIADRLKHIFMAANQQDGV